MFEIGQRDKVALYWVQVPRRICRIEGGGGFCDAGVGLASWGGGCWGGEL